MKDYKIGDEIEIKLRVKVMDNRPFSSSLEVKNITAGIWETRFETIIIEEEAKDRVISNAN